MTRVMADPPPPSLEQMQAALEAEHGGRASLDALARITREAA
jgi:hypothetical protein